MDEAGLTRKFETSHVGGATGRTPRFPGRSLGWENPLEKEMATHFSILAREILWTEEPGGLQSMGLQRV